MCGLLSGGRCCWDSAFLTMLFFFEFAFFILALATVAALEFWGPLPAMGIAGTSTAISLAAWAMARWRRSQQPDRWHQAVLDSWHHLNLLLLAGFAILVAWTVLAR